MIAENVKTRALLSAIRHSGQPMTLSDPALPDHPIIAVNSAFEKLTGYPAAESTAGTAGSYKGRKPTKPPCRASDNAFCSNAGASNGS